MYAALLGVTILGGFAYKLELAKDAYIDLAATASQAAVIAAFAVVHRRDVVPLLGKSGLDLRGGGFTLAGCVALFLGGTAYFALFHLLGFRELTYWGPYDAVAWPAWAGFALVAAAPAFFEEIGFRGVIMAGLDRMMGPRESLFVQAAAFSVLHLSPSIFISHLGMGALFGYLRRKTGSLLPGMLLHAGWNAWVLVQERLAS
jgi:membrane protease YdiL (CAAX protease family)